MSEENKNDSTWLFVIIVIILLIFYFASLGNINPASFGKLPDELKESKEKAKQRHKRLLAILERQQALKARLDRRFRSIYFIIRFAFVFSWFAFLFILNRFGLVTNLGDALNWSEAIILFLLVVHFLTFGKISNLEKFIDLLKTKIENWLYGKHINLADKINSNQVETAYIENNLEQFNSSNIDPEIQCDSVNIAVNDKKSIFQPTPSGIPKLKP